jgi:hypothetical protein
MPGVIDGELVEQEMANRGWGEARTPLWSR